MKNKSRILGVDPGTQVTGYAILTHEDTPKLVVAGVIDLRRVKGHHEKLKSIFKRIYQIINTYEPTHMAIEAPFYGKNVQSMLKLGRAQGVALSCALIKGLETEEYAPKKIKQSITGNGNATKEQVAKMLEQLLTDDLSNCSLDATDALATAYCHHIQLSSNVLSSGKKYGGWGDFLKDNPDRSI